jgi:hypothetical protein
VCGRERERRNRREKEEEQRKREGAYGREREWSTSSGEEEARTEKEEETEEKEEKEDKRTLEEWEKEMEQRVEEVDRGELGGRLSRPEYLQRWREIGAAHLVEGGCRPDWADQPPPTPRDYTRRERYSGKMDEAMHSAINEEIARGVLEIISQAEADYVLSAFVVIKPNKIRLILDGRELNVYIREQAFKMTDWMAVRDAIRRFFWACKLDFSSAFHHLGVHPDLQRYLVFRYDGVYYRYVGLPFGLRSSPRLFSAAMTATMNAVRARWDILVVCYMDDILLLAENRDELRKSVAEIIEFCESLGWTVNREKSQMEPSQSIDYVGLNWNTVEMTVRMTTEKNRELKTLVKRWIEMVRMETEVRVRDLARLIGKLSATRPQHEEASLYLARLNRRKCEAVREDGWQAKTTLTRTLLTELYWWLRELRANEANDIRPFEPMVTAFTDASETGWGATLRRLKQRTRWMFGWWTENEVEVNCLRELAAIVLTVKRGVMKGTIEMGDDVMIRTDNTNAVYNLNRKRSGWRMRTAVKEFLAWLKLKRIRLRCKHVPGVKNITADSLSRLSRSGDYSLRTGLLKQIEKEMGVTAEVDLFATKLNRQCRRYATVERISTEDGDAVARDAMTIPWTDWTALAHPPIPMLQAVLAKIRRDGAKAILIAPNWRGAMWMHALRPSLVTKPIVLGTAETVLVAGPGMRAQRSSLPPGNIAAYLLDGTKRSRR